MPTPPTPPVPPRRIYIMFRDAWWRLSLEEWWWFVAAQLRSGAAGFPSVNLIGRPRAVIRHVAEDGTVTFESGDPAVWVAPIDDWQPSDWSAAAERLQALGMEPAASGQGPWPEGVTPPAATSPVYPLEDYQEAAPHHDAKRTRREGDAPV